jgi:WD40 repeat protein
MVLSVPSESGTLPRFFNGGKGLLFREGETGLVWFDLERRERNAKLEFQNPDTGGLLIFAGSADGRYIAAGGLHLMTIWNTSNLEEPERLIRAHESRINDIDFSPDSSLLLTSGDGAVKLWSALTGKNVFTRSAESDVTATAFSPGGRFFATAQSDGMLRLWSLPEELPQRGILSPKGNNFRVALSPDGRLATLAGFWFERGQRSIQVYGTNDANPVGEPITPGGFINGASFNSDGNELAVITSDYDRKSGEPIPKEGAIESHWFKGPGWIRFFDFETGKETREAIPTDAEPAEVIWGDDGLWVLCGNGTLIAFDQRVTTRRFTVSLGAPVVTHRASVVHRRMAFLPSGEWVAILLDEPFVRILHVETGEEIRRFPCGRFATDVAATLTGRRLAIAEDAQASVWNYRTGEKIGEFAQGARVVAVDFSADGSLLATAGRDRSARVWNLATGELACPALLHPDDVFDVRFHPNGRAVLTVCRNVVRYRGRLRTWEVATGRLLGPPIPLTGYSPRSIELI